MARTTMRDFPWKLEALSLLGVAVSFVALIILLRAFDGRPVFEWYSITLNTVVSIISVILRALLMYPIAECIGQWKWILFGRSARSLMHFEQIDSASRGPVGVLSLTWQKDIPWTLRMGLISSILLLIVDPFSQQLVQLESGLRWVGSMDGVSALSPRAYKYDELFLKRGDARSTNPSASDQVGGDLSASLAMQQAILNGLAQGPENIARQVNVSCPSGNCTWDPFVSLGVCQKCENLTSEIEKVGDFKDIYGLLEESQADGGHDADEVFQHPTTKGNFTAFYLPNGLLLGNQNGCAMAHYTQSIPGCKTDDGISWNLMISSYSTSNPNNTVSMQHLDTMVWSMSELHVGETPPATEIDETPKDQNKTAAVHWPDVPILAAECALYYCTKSFHDRFEGNVVYENTTEETAAVMQGYDPTNPDLNPDLMLRYPDKPHAPNFTLAETTMTGIQNFFEDTMTFSWKYEAKAMNIVQKYIPKAKVLLNGFHSSFSTQPASMAGMMRGNNTFTMENQFKAMAISMTNAIRNSGTGSVDEPWVDPLVKSLDMRTNDPVHGHVGLPTTVYRSEWPWISLHGVVIFLGVAFCAMTFSNARPGIQGQRAWKNHSLATLKEGSTLGYSLQDASTIEELEKIAKSEAVSMPLEKTATPLDEPADGGENITSATR